MVTSSWGGGGEGAAVGEGDTASAGLRFSGDSQTGLSATRQHLIKYLKVEHGKVSVKSPAVVPWPPFTPRGHLAQSAAFSVVTMVVFANGV